MAVFHEHHQEEGHHHTVRSFNAAFVVSILANGVFVVAQIIFSYLTNSTSLLADAIHNLGDVLSLVLAWIANLLLKRTPTHRSTYGMKKTTILASFANGVLLIFTCGIIVSEAIYQFFSPSEIKTVGVMLVASIGILVNAGTAALFLGGMSDLNIRAAFLHLLYDALISLGVVLSAAVIYWTHWGWVDSIVALLIAVVILKGTWSLFSDSFRLIIDGVPRGISITKVRQLLEDQTGVEGVHDLHVWALSTQENALSVHLWMPDQPLTDAERMQLTQRLYELFKIHHTTFQVERSKAYCDDTCSPYL